MKNNKKVNRRNTIISIVLLTAICVMCVVSGILYSKLSKEKNNSKNFAKEVSVLVTEKSELNKNHESQKAAEEELSKKVDELESEKESMSVKNDELESMIAASGIKEQVPADKKIVYLTFDDGPSDLTPQFLDVLDKYNVNATFFVTYQPQHEDIYKDIIKRKNSIQIHTATHDYDTIYSSVDAYINDFNTIYDYVKNVTGTTPNYFRFPGGSTNSYGKGVVKTITRSMKDKGYDFVDWNVSVGDGSAAATRESIVEKIKNESEGKNHIVMLAHDSGTKTETLAALPEIIEYYQSNGYEFGVISGNVDMSFVQFIDY